MSFVDAHLQRRMGHRKGNELLPVLRTREPPRGFQPLVQGRRRQWGHQAKDRQPRRPSANFLQSSLRHARRVIIHAKDKRGDGKNVAPGEPVEHHGIFTWLVEAFFYGSKVGRIDGFHSDEDPFASCGRDQINELLIAQQIGVIWATQCTCALAAMMSRSNDFVRFTLMAKLSSMKNTAIWPPSSRARAFSSKSSFTTLSLVRKRMESPKNPVTVQNSHP